MLGWKTMSFISLVVVFDNERSVMGMRILFEVVL